MTSKELEQIKDIISQLQAIPQTMGFVKTINIKKTDEGMFVCCYDEHGNLHCQKSIERA